MSVNIMSNESKYLKLLDILFCSKHRIHGIGVGIVMLITIMSIINFAGDILLELYNDTPFAIALYTVSYRLVYCRKASR